MLGSPGSTIFIADKLIEVQRVDAFGLTTHNLMISRTPRRAALGSGTPNPALDKLGPGVRRLIERPMGVDALEVKSVSVGWPLVWWHRERLIAWETPRAMLTFGDEDSSNPKTPQPQDSWAVEWTGLLADACLYLLVVAAISIGWSKLKAWKHRGGCPACGYNLAGLRPGAVCPECGSAVNMAGPNPAK